MEVEWRFEVLFVELRAAGKVLCRKYDICLKTLCAISECIGEVAGRLSFSRGLS